jgi:hypothetical protein
MATKKLDLTSTLKKFKSFESIGMRYLSFILVLLSLGVYSFIVFRINSLITAEPTDEQIIEKLQTVQRPKIDQVSIDKINQLSDNSVEVKAIFKEARQNPFQE